jgi:hypothetical protein
MSQNTILLDRCYLRYDSLNGICLLVTDKEELIMNIVYESKVIALFFSRNENNNSLY